MPRDPPLAVSAQPSALVSGSNHHQRTDVRPSGAPVALCSLGSTAPARGCRRGEPSPWRGGERAPCDGTVRCHGATRSKQCRRQTQRSFSAQIPRWSDPVGPLTGGSVGPGRWPRSLRLGLGTMAIPEAQISTSAMEVLPEK